MIKLIWIYYIHISIELGYICIDILIVQLFISPYISICKSASTLFFLQSILLKYLFGTYLVCRFYLRKRLTTMSSELAK